MKKIEIVKQKTKESRQAAVEGFNNLFKPKRKRKPIPVFKGRVNEKD